jgi:hypothetical protein
MTRAPTPTEVGSEAPSAAEAGTVSVSPLHPSISNIDHVVSVSGPLYQTSMAHCVMPSPPPLCSTGPSLCPPSSPSASPRSPPESSPPHPYFLRSRSHAKDLTTPQAGLGISLPEAGSQPTRGRKSHLSKAIKIAGAEVVSGQQSTIVGVLKAGQAPRGVPP